MKGWKDLGMTVATAAMIAMSIACGVVAAWFAETSTDWTIVLSAWFCGALAAHANRNIVERDKHNEVAEWVNKHTHPDTGATAPFDWCKCDICEGYRERDAI